MLEDKFKLVRFLDAQNKMYLKALTEIMNGQKQSRWMWFIFPQVRGLGTSDASNYYGIRNLEEAAAYLDHTILRKHLLEITQAVDQLEGKEIQEIFPEPDHLKFHSSMTLFSLVENTDPMFSKVLAKYFGGNPDKRTLELLGLEK